MDALKLEDPICNNWDKYICRKLGSQLPAFYRQLHDAQDSNLKRSMKHTEQAKKCLDCLTLLGQIKGITEAEEANKEMLFHGSRQSLHDENRQSRSRHFQKRGRVVPHLARSRSQFTSRSSAIFTRMMAKY